MHGVISLPDVISLQDDKSSILPNIVHVCSNMQLLCIHLTAFTKDLTLSPIHSAQSLRAFGYEYAYLTFAPSCFD